MQMQKVILQKYSSICRIQECAYRKQKEESMERTDQKRFINFCGKFAEKWGTFANESLQKTKPYV